MREFADIHALAAAQGSHLGYSPWHTVTQEQINQFADATGDHQWIHVDVARAASGPFGSTIAHGFLSLSLLPMFTEQIYRLQKAPAMAINYGLNKVRFLQPVRVDSRIRDSLELAEAKETPKGILLTMRHEVQIDGVARPALAAETLSLVIPLTVSLGWPHRRCHPKASGSSSRRMRKTAAGSEMRGGQQPPKTLW